MEKQEDEAKKKLRKSHQSGHPTVHPESKDAVLPKTDKLVPDFSKQRESYKNLRFGAPPNYYRDKQRNNNATRTLDDLDEDSQQLLLRDRFEPMPHSIGAGPTLVYDQGRVLRGLEFLSKKTDICLTNFSK
jgi:hypothetical protein